MTPKLLTIPLIAALAFSIAACSPNQEVPTTPPTTPTDSTNAPVNGGNQGKGELGGNFTPDPDEPIYNEGDTPPEVTEDDITFIGEKEGQANNSLFWEENSYGINPEKIFVPKEVIDAFGEEQTDTLPQAVLASISEATTQSPLKAPYNKEEAPINAMLLNEFASKWLMGDAQNKFQQGAADYAEGKNDSFADTFYLYPHAPSDNNINGRVIRDGETWNYWIHDLTITGIDQTQEGSPQAIVTYRLESNIPVEGEKGKRNILFSLNMTLKLEPGFEAGDWLISDYSHKNPEGK